MHGLFAEGAWRRREEGEERNAALTYDKDGKRRHPIEENAVRGLWQAVLMQALTDSVSASLKAENFRARAEALVWFDVKNDDFCEVCQLAGFLPYRVVNGAKKALIQARTVSASERRARDKTKRRSESVAAYRKDVTDHPFSCLLG